MHGVPSDEETVRLCGSLGNRFRQDLFCLAGVGAHRFKERLRFFGPGPPLGRIGDTGGGLVAVGVKPVESWPRAVAKAPAGDTPRVKVSPPIGGLNARNELGPPPARACAGGKKTATPFGVERHTRTCLLRHKVGKSLESPGYRLSPRGRLSSLAPTAMSCKPGRQLGRNSGDHARPRREPLRAAAERFPFRGASSSGGKAPLPSARAASTSVTR